MEVVRQREPSLEKVVIAIVLKKGRASEVFNVCLDGFSFLLRFEILRIDSGRLRR